ncbi:hypothetical protein ACVIU4_011044, partial [Bradyrhizobium barranii subsp. barranii]
SKPRSAKGNCLRNSVSTVLSSVCSRTISGAHSVQPVTTSVRTRVCTKLPRADGPLCATRSASTKPGAGSFQSAEVRIGILRRRACAAGRRRWRPSPSRIRPNARSIVAALIESSLPRISGARSRWLCPLHRVDQHRYQGFQPLPANPVRGFSEECERIAFGFTVNPAPRPTTCELCGILGDEAIRRRGFPALG